MYIRCKAGFPVKSCWLKIKLGFPVKSTIATINNQRISNCTIIEDTIQRHILISMNYIVDGIPRGREILSAINKTGISSQIDNN